MQEQQQDTRGVDDIETVYLYVYDEDPEQARRSPSIRWPRFAWPHISFNGKRIADLVMQWAAFAVLAACSLWSGAPFFTIQSITVPLHLLPVQHVQASATIVPTGVQIIPAVQAHGVLTIYNGSAVVESLPAGFIVTTRQGIEIATDTAVTIPAETPPVNGSATVAAHAVGSGVAGNIAVGAINAVVGSSLYVKNLSSFTGGQDASTTHYVTASDSVHTLAEARQRAQQRQAQTPPLGLLIRPCHETDQPQGMSVTVVLSCQYGTYTAPTGVTVLRVEVREKSVVLLVKTPIF